MHIWKVVTICLVAAYAVAQQATECEFDANGRVKPVEVKPQAPDLPPGPPLHLLDPLDLVGARRPDASHCFRGFPQRLS
jgi:hypothetical protein